MVQDGQRGTTTMADRAAEAQRATWVSVVVNLLLTALATWLQRRLVGEKKPLEVPPVGAPPR